MADSLTLKPPNQLTTVHDIDFLLAPEIQERVVIDLSDVSYMSPAGIVSLLSALESILAPIHRQGGSSGVLKAQESAPAHRG